MIKEKIIELLEKNIGEKVKIQVEVPRERNFGDYSSNVVFAMAKKSGQSPQEIAKEIAAKISQNLPDFLAKVETKNGFINFYLKPEWLAEQLTEILTQKENYGRNSKGKNQKIQIEFISANPTGPLTIGNSRGGAIGDTLANILEKSSWQVTREYYFNDAGGQIDDLGHSVLKDDQAVYAGDYIDGLNKKLKIKDKKLFDDQNYKEIGKLAAKELIKNIKITTKNMGIKFDVWTAEGADLRKQKKVEEIIDWLLTEKLAYKKDGAVWFSAAKFGDDKDRVLIRKTGEPTYFGVDCAYHKNKFVDRQFDQVIDIWGADHHGDVKRVMGFVKALGFEKNFKIILHQFVRLTEGGKEVRMSKRKGIYVLVDDLLKAVGRDVFRFFMLSYAANSHLDFDLAKAREQSEKNPVYYVQYAAARCASILRKSKFQNLKLRTNSKSKFQNLKYLKEPAEIELIKELIKYPDLIKDISEDYQVQKLPVYAIELADRFHNFYEKCRVIGENKKIEEGRIILLQATQIVLKNCLGLMEISAPGKM